MIHNVILGLTNVDLNFHVFFIHLQKIHFNYLTDDKMLILTSMVQRYRCINIGNAVSELKNTSVFMVLLLTSLVNSAFSSADVAENSKPTNKLKLIIRPNKDASVSSDQTFKYQLLKLALEKTKKKYGEFEIKEFQDEIKQERVISFMMQGDTFRVIATMTSPQRELDIWPIRIPLYKGLFGHRIFIIRAEDQSLFSAIKDVSDLKKLTAIQGHDWPDSDILQNAGFNVMRSPNYAGIFKMLRLNRGDYFPRGVHEPWQEVQKHKDKNLAVEKSLLIQYNAPFYFFVNYEDKELYSRIKEGFLMSINDGSFDRLFYNHPEVKSIFKNAEMGSRTIFRIKNSEFIKDPLFDQDSFWYKMGDEKRYFLNGKTSP